MGKIPGRVRPAHSQPINAASIVKAPVTLSALETLYESSHAHFPTGHTEHEPHVGLRGQALDRGLGDASMQVGFGYSSERGIDLLLEQPPEHGETRLHQVMTRTPEGVRERFSDRVTPGETRIAAPKQVQATYEVEGVAGPGNERRL